MLLAQRRVMRAAGPWTGRSRLSDGVVTAAMRTACRNTPVKALTCGTTALRLITRQLSTKAKGGGADSQNLGKNGAGGMGSRRQATKGGSSGMWMKRHLQDPYVAAAVESGVPSRAAFKLVEINNKHRILAPGDRVVDLGAAPGGWSMVAARIIHGGDGCRVVPGSRRPEKGAGGGMKRSRGGGGAPPRLPPPLSAKWERGEKKNRGEMAEMAQGGGAVVAVDLLEMEALPGVEAICGDFRDHGIEERIFTSLAGVSNEGDGLHPPPSPLSRTSGASPGNNDTSGKDESMSEPFRLRGTSGSEMLLPRPIEPATDSFEDLCFAAETASTAERCPNSEPNDGHPDSNIPTPDPNPGVNTSANSPSARSMQPQTERSTPARTGTSEALLPTSSRSAQERTAPGVTTARPPPKTSPRSPSTRDKRRNRANVVLSDMAPSFSGDRDIDQARVAGLALQALAACLGDESGRLVAGRTAGEARELFEEAGAAGLASSREMNAISGEEKREVASSGVNNLSKETDSRSDRRGDKNGHSVDDEVGRHMSVGLLARGGTFLGKLFAGRDEKEVKQEAERLFQRVRIVKPPASRSGSSEMYILATGFLLGREKKR